MAHGELQELCTLCDMISFNSLTQRDQGRPWCGPGAGHSLRVNPEMSMVKDERYDPCRRHSKLGVPISDLRDLLRTLPEWFERLEGILVHSNSESDDFRDMLLIV
jgi:carboxynorspermidine decarboxylase